MEIQSLYGILVSLNSRVVGFRTEQVVGSLCCGPVLWVVQCVSGQRVTLGDPGAPVVCTPQRNRGSCPPGAHTCCQGAGCLGTAPCTRAQRQGVDGIVGGAWWTDKAQGRWMTGPVLAEELKL